MRIKEEKLVAEAYYNEFVSAFNKKRYNRLRPIFDKYLEFIEETDDLSDEEISEVDLMFDRFIKKNSKIINKYLYRK